MKKYLILLVMAIPCFNALADRGVHWAVGGSNALPSGLAGGGYDNSSEGIVFDDAISANGGVGYTTTTGDFDGIDTVTATGIGTASTAGVFIYISDGGGDIVTQRVTILSTPTADTIIIPDVGNSTVGDVIVNVGGALLEIGDLPQSPAAGNGLAGGDHVWVRGTHDTEQASDGSVFNLSTAGTINAPIVFISHFGEPTGSVGFQVGDFGIATLDANVNTLANAMETSISGDVYAVFIGIRFTGGSDDGVNLNTLEDDNVTFVRCQFDNNDPWGLQGDNDIQVLACNFELNTVGGVDIDENGRVIDCIFTGNGFGAVSSNFGVYINNIFSGHTGVNAIRSTGVGAVFYGNTIDMADVASSVAIFQDSSSVESWMAVNNIIVDSVTGFGDDSTINERAVLYYNFYDGVTNPTSTDNNIFPVPAIGDDFGNTIQETGLVFSAGFIPLEALRGLGIDAQYAQSYWADYNDGAGDNPPDPLLLLSEEFPGSIKPESAGGGVTTGGGRRGRYNN